MKLLERIIRLKYQLLLLISHPVIQQLSAEGSDGGNDNDGGSIPEETHSEIVLTTHGVPGCWGLPGPSQQNLHTPVPVSPASMNPSWLPEACTWSAWVPLPHFHWDLILVANQALSTHVRPLLAATAFLNRGHGITDNFYFLTSHFLKFQIPYKDHKTAL